MLGRTLRHLRSNAVAYAALFIALSGTSYAVVSIPRNSVGRRQLKANAVNSAKVADHSLLARDFGGKLPSGPKGATGAQGPQGLQGERGIQGETGPSTGPAGGDLTGNYPAPALRDGVVGPSRFAALPAAAVTGGTPRKETGLCATNAAWNSGDDAPVLWNGTTGDFDETGTGLTRCGGNNVTGVKAPIAGVYEVAGGLTWSANATGTRKTYLLLQPADMSAPKEIAASEGAAAPTASTLSQQSISAIVSLKANDTVRLKGIQSSGGSLSLTAARLSIAWLAPPP